MRTLAFLDCPTGIAGDMFLGALVSAGVPLSYLQAQLNQLNLPEALELQVRCVRCNGIAATKVEVVLPHATSADTLPPLRHLQDIEQIITAADLPEQVTAWSLAIFRRLAIAEGAIHGVDPQTVHFHEVGATDAIADIVGTCLGLDWLKVETLVCAPLPTGRGTIRAAHGRLPVPAPAVLKLMEMAQVPIYNAGLQGELVTPTGAAIATELASYFGEPPAMHLRKVGLGAGNKALPMPNILRLWIGHDSHGKLDLDRPVDSTFLNRSRPQADSSHSHRPAHNPPPSHPHSHDPDPNHHSRQGFPVRPDSSPADCQVPVIPGGSLGPAAADTAADIEQRQGRETVTVLETQVDDLTPQAIGYLCDRLLQSSALDVFTQNVVMKKSRPGHLITVITYPEQAQYCEEILLRETTTLGVRNIQQSRMRLRREIVPIETPSGTVRMKVAFAPHSDQPLKAYPEYEDCAALARQQDRPWREIHTEALCYWQGLSQNIKALPPAS